MSISTNESRQVSPEEIGRRIAEYRRIGLDRDLPVQVVYQDPHVTCPWPGCDLRINGIQFHVEKWPELEKRLREAWWKGPGLVGRCPQCDRPVLFTVTSKSAVQDLTLLSAAILPDDWHENAHVVTKTGTPVATGKVACGSFSPTST